MISFAQIFAMAEDELTQQRASDLGDIKTEINQDLIRDRGSRVSVLFRKELFWLQKNLTPSMTAGINPANVEGVLTEIGGKTSHSAIICPFMEIPAVLSVENIVSIVKDGDVVVSDGATGEAYVNPEDSVLEDYKAKKAAYLEEKAAVSKFIGQALHRLLTDMWSNWLPISAVRMRLQKLWSVTGKVWDYSVPSSYLWTATAYLPKKNSSKHIKQLQKLWKENLLLSVLWISEETRHFLTSD